MMLSITKIIYHQSCTNEYESLVKWYWQEGAKHSNWRKM